MKEAVQVTRVVESLTTSINQKANHVSRSHLQWNDSRLASFCVLLPLKSVILEGQAHPTWYFTFPYLECVPESRAKSGLNFGSRFVSECGRNWAPRVWLGFVPDVSRAEIIPRVFRTSVVPWIGPGFVPGCCLNRNSKRILQQCHKQETDYVR